MQNTTKTTDARGLGGLLRSHAGWFLWLTFAAAALRLFFVFRFPSITPDGVIYGDIAKNWLVHHVYGLSGPLGPMATYIRLPGYPALLAALWRVFGVEHYNAVRFAQVVIDIGTCLVIADLARRVAGFRSQEIAKWAFALAALCPFLANYTAVPLTETPAIFLAALALDFAVAALGSEQAGRSLQYWAACGLAIAGGIYLRPDGGMMLIAIGGYLLWRLITKAHKSATVWAGLVLAACSLLPLAPWTARNWRVSHHFQPLAPVHAEDPGEYYASGFEKWMRTWLADYASLEDVGFRVDGEEININTLPDRAFDSAAERSKTAELLEQYNDNLSMTPELDAQFAELARQRIHRRPFRYHLALPVVRALDLWFRPRTEMLPLNSHWWKLRDDPHDFAWSLWLAVVNFGYVLLALAGAFRGREMRCAGMLAGFVAVRTVLITALASPEPRYVLECFPVMIVFAAVALVKSSVVSRQPSAHMLTASR